jgi:hypothetical protein
MTLRNLGFATYGCRFWLLVPALAQIPATR